MILVNQIEFTNYDVVVADEKCCELIHRYICSLFAL